jgi:hypothetical protein
MSHSERRVSTVGRPNREAETTYNVDELQHVWILIRTVEPKTKVVNDIHWKLMGNDGFEHGRQLILKSRMDYTTDPGL